MSTGGDRTIPVRSGGQMQARTLCSTLQLEVILEMIFQPRTISITSRPRGMIQHGTGPHRVVVHTPACPLDMVIIRAHPRHMQPSRPTDPPPMTIQRVTFPPQAHVFPTFHRSTFTTTRHPKPLPW